MAEMSQFTSVFRAKTTTDSAKVAKRTRQPLACGPCRIKKLKCDRQHPCGACSKRGDESTCKFTGSSIVNTTNPKHEVQSRLQRLEDMIHTFIRQKDDSESHKRKRSLEKPAGDKTASFIEDSPDYPHSSRSVTSNQNTSDSISQGAALWVDLLENIHDIRVAITLDTESPPAASSVPSSLERPDLLFGPSASITIEEALEFLPSKPETDKLIALYFGEKLTAVPFIHVHQFQRQYEAFWANPHSASFIWISILFSMVYISSRIVHFRGLVEIYGIGTREPIEYLDKSAQCLLQGEYLKAKAMSIEALLIHAFTRNLQSRNSDPVLWSIFSLVTRLAQRRGYHRDPTRLAKTFTPFEVEMRRRTWFFIDAFDLLYSFQLGIPSVVHQDESDTLPPGNYTDDDFDEDTVEMPPYRSASDPTASLYVWHKARLCKILRQVIQHALSVKEAKYSDTCYLHDVLESFHSQVSPCLRNRPIRTTSFSDETHIIMHRIMLELLYKKALCVLHRNYLSQDRDNEMYNRSREACRDAALGILDLHAEFVKELEPEGRLSGKSYMLPSLTLHDFLVAALVICLDLSEGTNLM
jgi:hypothetical protein